MKSLKLAGKNISKSFVSGKVVLNNVSLELVNGDIHAVTGENGSGKSTLLKIMCGVLRPTSGEIIFELNGERIAHDRISSHVGFVSPYLNIYEEFTPVEHFRLISRIRGATYNNEKADELLNKFNLFKRRNDAIRTFSSGMKQRVKYIISLLPEPQLLFLDEPTTNLDNDGITSVLNSVFEHQSRGGAVVIASNDEREISICQKVISLAKNY